MIICEYDFDRPDPKNQDYSMAEVDYYAWIPVMTVPSPGLGIPNHRLSLRKNLRTGKFEVYRRFYDRTFLSRNGLAVLFSKDTGFETVIFKSESLEKAIEFACGMVLKHHGEKEEDVVCTHEYPIKATGCKGRTDV